MPLHSKIKRLVYVTTPAVAQVGLAFIYSYKWTAGSYRMDVEVLHFFGCQKSLERLEKALQRSQKTVGQNKLEKDKTSDARQQGNVIDISITIIISQ